MAKGQKYAEDEDYYEGNDRNGQPYNQGNQSHK